MRKYTEKDLENFIEKDLLSGGYIKRQSDDYDKNFGIDTKVLFEFLKASQEKSLNDLALRVGTENLEQRLLKRISSECDKKGTFYVLKNGFSENGITFKMLYPKPNNSLNETSIYNYSCNKFSVIRQLYFSKHSKESIDIVIFINGLSVATIELKNPFTNQNTQNAISQYAKRNPNEMIFKRCIVHFALDCESAYMSTKLERENTKFLPFNKGLNDGLAGIKVLTGAGNPPSDGIKTAYLWQRILSKEVLTSIILKYVQTIKKDDKNILIFPRYHQFDVVDKLLKDCYDKGVGQRYLIQHSAGSGKSNSISWLALNLIELHKDNKPVFDSVIVITDRKVLDRQIRDNLKSFEHKGGLIASVNSSKELKDALENNKKIIISTIQKFPYIASSIANLSTKTFAVIIDEAHSSQDGQMSASLNESIMQKDKTLLNTTDIDEVLEQIANNKKLQANASYFAFTATPKPKTLEKFGKAVLVDGEKKFFPYHLYSMKQAVEEGYILDVLKGYITYESFYKLREITNGDKKYDEKKAKARLKKFVESDEFTIEKKANIICEHFITHIVMQIGSKAKAMVVANSRESVLKYYFAISKNLHLPYKALVAFSGELEFDGKKYTESSVNGISETELKKVFKKDDYKFLIVAEKYQTGFDEPLLHTMYVDKPLSGISAVQTLSRLNRVCKNKNRTCVVDFANTHEDIAKAFSKFYENSYLENESDPNKIFDLKDNIKSFGFFSDDEVSEFVRYVVEEKEENFLHSFLDMIAYRINKSDEEEKTDFYQHSKNYIKSYEFFSQILPYADTELEKFYIFLSLLICKINISRTTLEKDLLANVDFDSYRVQLSAKMDIKLSSNGAFKPSSADGSKRNNETILDELTNIIKSFNEKYGNFAFSSDDKIKRYMTSIKDDVLEDKNFSKSLKNYDRQNTKIAFDEILTNVLLKKCDEYLSFYTSFCNDENFKTILSSKIYDYVVEEYRNMDLKNT